MEMDLYTSLYELKEMLNNDERIVLLNKIDQEMSENEEVILLTYNKDKANDKLVDMMKYYKDDSNEVKEARIALMKAKEALYNHPLVKQYNKAYQEVRDLYNELNKVLFSDLNLNMCEKKL